VIENETDNLMVASTGYCVLRCKDDADVRYMFNFCQSPYFIEDMTTQATGASYPAVSTSIVKSSLIPYYSVEEQHEIAKKIDAVSNLIALRKQQLSKLDELVKSRFIEMFGDGRDGKTPVRMLGGICKFQQGTQIPVDEQFEEQKSGYKRFLRIIDYTQAPQPPRFVNVNGKKVDEKSVVIVRYGATAGFVGRGYQGILANNLFEIMPDETILSKDFLFLALKYGTFEKEVHDKAFGAAMPALSFSMMNDIPVVVPMPEQQQQFVSFVEQVDKSKFEIQKSLEKFETLKKVLMQKYFG
jgi:type I restriction enzyme S subunit